METTVGVNKGATRTRSLDYGLCEVMCRVF